MKATSWFNEASVCIILRCTLKTVGENNLTVGYCHDHGLALVSQADFREDNCSHVYRAGMSTHRLSAVAGEASTRKRYALT
jgi:hypothetical protein